MTSAHIFVETSIQIRRVLAPRLVQAQLEDHFAQLAPRIYTSEYVWMEFQRTVLADYAHVRRLMLEHHGWGDVMAQLLSGQRAFRSRAAVRCTQILGSLYNESHADWQYALTVLDQALRRRLRMLFWTHVNPLPDPIICDLVVAGVTPQADGNYAVAAQCQKRTAACRLPDFLADHAAELQAIAAYLSAHPRAIKNQAKVMRLLSAISTDPRAALGQGNCWPLGDVIIVLQMPTDAALWTLDADFKPLTAALGLQLFTPAIG